MNLGKSYIFHQWNIQSNNRPDWGLSDTKKRIYNSSMAAECPIRDLRIRYNLPLNCDGCKGDTSSMGANCTPDENQAKVPEESKNPFVRANLEYHYPKATKAPETAFPPPEFKSRRATLVEELENIPLTLFKRPRYNAVAYERD